MSDQNGSSILRNLVVLVALVGAGFFYTQKIKRSETKSPQSEIPKESLVGSAESRWIEVFEFKQKTQIKAPRTQLPQVLNQAAQFKVYRDQGVTYFKILTKESAQEVFTRASFDREGHLQVEISERSLKKNPHLELLIKELLSAYYYELDEDLLGSFESDKKQLSQGYFQKTKLLYRDHPEVRILTSRRMIRLNEAKELVLLEEVEKIHLGNAALRIEVELERELRALGKRQETWEDKTSEKLKLSRLQVQNSQLSQAANLTVTKPLKQLLRGLNVQDSRMQNLELIKQMVDRLHQSPSELQELLTYLDKKSLSAKEIKTLQSVLFQSGDAQAHERLISDCKKTAHKDFYFNGWAMVEGVLPGNTIDYLISTANDPSVGTHDQKGALLALGSQVGLSDQSNVELVDFFKKKALEAKTDEEKLSWLISVGNAKTNEFLPEIKGYLNSSNPQMIREALMSLRNVPSSEAEQILKSYLTSPHPALSRAAQQSLQMRQQ